MNEQVANVVFDGGGALNLNILYMKSIMVIGESTKGASINLRANSTAENMSEICNKWNPSQSSMRLQSVLKRNIEATAQQLFDSAAVK